MVSLRPPGNISEPPCSVHHEGNRRMRRRRRKVREEGGRSAALALIVEQRFGEVSGVEKLKIVVGHVGTLEALWGIAPSDGCV